MGLLKNSMVEAHRKGPVHDDDDDDLVHSFSSSSSSSGISSGSSMESADSLEEETSSKFLPSSSNHLVVAHDSLSDMSSLFQQLPIKMGLSRHYQGKSRSFTSLASVRGLEDLGKEENAEKNKKKKCCRRSYGEGGLWRTNALSRHIGKREWSSSTSRPPIPPPPRSTNTPIISNQTPLFA
ncbi:uncharacterized protein LOC114756289 [Neltuma alba]|uniref:uncharacterized protein LOC114756289 n=1 Tax=Neltuma alba TaxID=207710 RepID=UPI0010A41AC7|nr:uncharacterized protein LOC114756289 [Prosopis alba]